MLLALLQKKVEEEVKTIEKPKARELEEKESSWVSLHSSTSARAGVYTWSTK